jgi:Family of unknown function (DUF6084)
VEVSLPTGAAVYGDAVPDLSFAVEGAEPVKYAAAPTLCFKLRIGADRSVRSMQLDTQIRISAARRAYSSEEKEGLRELFGNTEGFERQLRSLLWTHTMVLVPSFSQETVIDMHVPCTYDFDVTAARYLHALRSGEVPLELLFSGTVFYEGEGRALQVARISWNDEASYRLPVAVWRATMDHYFPNATWLRLDRDCFDRLLAFRARGALPSWEAAIDELLSKLA